MTQLLRHLFNPGDHEGEIIDIDQTLNLEQMLESKTCCDLIN